MYVCTYTVSQESVHTSVFYLSILLITNRCHPSIDKRVHMYIKLLILLLSLISNM